MSWYIFKFVVWFCKWQNKRHLAIAIRHHDRAWYWFNLLADIGDRIARQHSERFKAEKRL